MTTFVLDNFTDPNGTSLFDHTPDVDVVGDGWKLVQPPGAGPGTQFQIQNNKCQVPQNSNPNKQPSMVLIDTGASDFRITGQVTTTNESEIDLFFRAQDDNNYLSLVVDRFATGSMILRKEVAGSITNLAFVDTDIFGAGTFDFEIVVDGSSIVVTDLTNGFSLTVTETDFMTNTKVGFGDSDSNAVWTVDYLVESVPVGTGNVQAEATSFDMPVATGLVKITSPELGSITPKAVAFYWSWTQPGNVEDLVAAFGNGAATGQDNQWAWAILQDDVQPQMGSRSIFTDKCIVMPDQNGGLSTDFEAEFVQFIPGGAQIKVTKATTPGFQVLAIFFAGVDVEALADNHPTTPDPLDLTNIGFEPDFVIAATGAPVAAGTVVADVRGGYGWQDFATTPNEVGLYVRNETPSGLDPLSRRPTGQIAGNLSGFGIPTTSFRYEAPVADGMTARFDVGTASDLIGFLAVRATGVQVAAGPINSPVVTGDWIVSNPGFTPQFVLLLLCMRRNFDQTPDGEARRYGVGVFTPDTERSPTLFLNSGGVSADHTSHFVQKAVTLASEPTGVIEFEGEFKSMDTFGWTLDMSVADPQIKKWGWLAIGQGSAAPVTPAEDIICVPNPWTS